MEMLFEEFQDGCHFGLQNLIPHVALLTPTSLGSIQHMVQEMFFEKFQDGCHL